MIIRLGGRERRLFWRVGGFNLGALRLLLELLQQRSVYQPATSDAKSNEHVSAIFLPAVLGVLGFRCQAFCVIFWRCCPHDHHDHHNKTRLRDKQVHQHFSKVGEGYQAVIPLSASSCALEWLLDCSYGGAMPQVLIVIIIFDIFWILER